MDETRAAEEQAATTPIFNVYRRGYDPEQVDRYVGDQQRRLDEALHRASESERKLAAAVGQLRELHRRVAVYESEGRNTQPAQLDTLGERVQRILQEAWEGAYNLRQEAEQEVNELREAAERDVTTLRAQAEKEIEELRQVASKEAATAVDEATQNALSIRDETERRRQAYLEQVERDRERAIAQLSYLYDQREGAVAELVRLQATVQATVEELMRSPLAKPTAVAYEAGEVVNEGAAGEGDGIVEDATEVAGAVAGAGDTRDAGGQAVPLLGAEGAEAPAEDSGEPTASASPEVSSPGTSAVTEGPARDASAVTDAPDPDDAFPATGEAARVDRDGTGEATEAHDGATSETGHPDDIGDDEPTVPMERFVLPKDREAARAAMGKRPAATGKAEAAEADKAEQESPADPGEEGTITSGGSKEPPAAVRRSSSRRGHDPSPGAGVADVDTLPLQAAETAAPSSDLAARPPVVKPKHGLFDVEQEGWS